MKNNTTPIISNKTDIRGEDIIDMSPDKCFSISGVKLPIIEPTTIFINTQIAITTAIFKLSKIKYAIIPIIMEHNNPVINPTAPSFSTVLKSIFSSLLDKVIIVSDEACIPTLPPIPKITGTKHRNLT